MDSDDDSYSSNNSDDDHADSQLNQQEKLYTVLSEADIRRRQIHNIASVCNVLSVSPSEAGILLHHYNWCVEKAVEAWFADEFKVRKTVGITNNFVAIDNDNELSTCGICFDDFSSDEIKSVACGHPFCSDCWEGYLTASINDGPGCLSLRCPVPKCTAAIGRDMVHAIVPDEIRNKYDAFVLKTFVEINKNAKWCTAPGCDYVIEYELDGSRGADVKCRCSNNFCWNCGEEAHRPVDCATVSKWSVKNTSEAENTTWILANTKQCPKCNRSIEKNNGCMQMTCRQPCGHRFCWLCLGPSNYSCKCHMYKAQPTKGDEKREIAKKSLLRYAHYYERWAANNKSRVKAAADLKRMEDVLSENLMERMGIADSSKMKFVVEAWSQIVECRRVLKWTYAYGFYLGEEEVVKRQLFEYLQGEAEAGLDRLHECAEKELNLFFKVDVSAKRFVEFRSKLLQLTSVTRTYFGNLVQALENGLSEVDCSSSSRSRRNGAKMRKRKAER